MDITSDPRLMREHVMELYEAQKQAGLLEEEEESGRRPRKKAPREREPETAEPAKKDEGATGRERGRVLQMVLGYMESMKEGRLPGGKRIKFRAPSSKTSLADLKAMLNQLQGIVSQEQMRPMMDRIYLGVMALIERFGPSVTKMIGIGKEFEFRGLQQTSAKTAPMRAQLMEEFSIVYGPKFLTGLKMRLIQTIAADLYLNDALQKMPPEEGGSGVAAENDLDMPGI